MVAEYRRNPQTGVRREGSRPPPDDLRMWYMIELVFGHIDLARVRFAHSPIRELVASLLVLQDPRRQPMYGRWLSTVRRRLGGVRLEVLVALVPAGRILLTFLLPAPTGPRPTLAD